MQTKPILTIATVALAVFLAWHQYRKHTDVPPLPFFTQTILDESGKEISGSRFMGKYILVSYFQTWCGDCARELPSIQQLADEVGKEKLEVVLISDEDFQKINAFKGKFGSNLSFYRSKESLKALGISVYPSTYLIDPKGKIRLSKLEGFDWSSTVVKQLIH